MESLTSQALLAVAVFAARRPESQLAETFA